MQISFGAAQTVSVRPCLAEQLAQPPLINPEFRVDSLDEFDGQGFRHVVTSGAEKVKLDNAPPNALSKILAQFTEGNPLKIPFVESVGDLAKRIPNLLLKG